MTEEPEAPTPRDTSDLPVDEGYAVACLRTMKSPLRHDQNGRMVMWCGSVPVCTYDALFRMLGRGILALDPEAPRVDRYVLTSEWG